MRKNTLILTLLAVFCAQALFAAVDVAPAVPDLVLPSEDNLFDEKPQAKPAVEETVAEKAPEVAPVKPVAKKKRAGNKTKKKTPAPQEAPKEVPAVAPTVQEPAQQPVAPSTAAVAEPVAIASAPMGEGETFEPAREQETPADATQEAEKKEPKVLFNPATDRDPTLSVDDTLLLKHREEERLRAIEAERQRKIEAERRRLAEIERQRQLELERLRDPSREIRGRIRINGIIGQEVFIGDRVYGVGSTVLGARIVQVLPESVVFSYKGQRFTKKVQLK